MSKLPCYKCGKNMLDESTGNPIVGVSIESYLKTDEVTELIKTQYGKYWDKLPMRVCMECWIDNMVK